jgi:hypothetical protein
VSDTDPCPNCRADFTRCPEAREAHVAWCCDPTRTMLPAEVASR